ncbi:hypothetical protein EG329_003201 [Mollisiaceae sp. DMI_Dod_QoI]|nr:hypothetical protein EG329_003201 [Helotiales sp. DMI_Dod_QoI]
MAAASILTIHDANITLVPSISPQGPSIHAQGPPNFTVSHAYLGQDTVQVLPQPAYPPTRRDWEAYRTIFTHLYLTENRSLKEVMSIMEDQYKFRATPRMFKRKVTDWNLNKNYKAAEREAIAREVERYRSKGDPIPTILVRGQPLKMHRIQRHCKIGQLFTTPFRSARSFDSGALNNNARQIRSDGFIAEYDEETNLVDNMRDREGNLPEMMALFATPLRQLSQPGELKHAEFVLYQTNIFYETYAKSMARGEMTSNTAMVSETKLVAQAKYTPKIFINQVRTALCLGQRRATWRLLNEAMDMIKPMLASKHPATLQHFIYQAWEWEGFLSPDLYRVIWGHISKMASIVLGNSDPLSKVCLAITRLMLSIFERTLGSHNAQTLTLKSNYINSFVNKADFAEAERLQRMLIPDFEKLGHHYRQDIVREVYRLGCILNKKADFSSAKFSVRLCSSAD